MPLFFVSEDGTIIYKGPSWDEALRMFLHRRDCRKPEFWDGVKIYEAQDITGKVVG